MDFKKHYAKSTVYPKEITVRGETDTVHVRRLPNIELRKYQSELMSDSVDVRAQAGYSALVKAIRNEDGSPATTYEELKKYEVGLIKELIRVFQEVNTSEEDAELGND